MIRFRCPHCGASIEVAPAAAGKSGKCTTCKNRIQVPDAVPSPLPQVSSTRPIPTSGLAIASMVLGIVALLFFCVPFVSVPAGLLGILFAMMALPRARAGLVTGSGLATAGIICSLIGMAPVMLALLGLTGLGIMVNNLAPEAPAENARSRIPVATSNTGTGTTLTDNTSHTAVSSRWIGTWEGDGQDSHHFSFQMILNRQGTAVEGRILWTLLAAPEGSIIANRVGDTGTEFVEGTFADREFYLSGVRVDNNRLLGKDEYRLVVAEDGQSFEGRSRGHGGTWTCVMRATIAAAP